LHDIEIVSESDMQPHPARGSCVRAVSGAFLGVLLVVLAHSAASTPVAYDEAVDGDIASTVLPIFTFAFDIGVNTVTGTIGIETEAGETADHDSFGFVVPAGLRVISGGVVLSELAGEFDQGRWTLYDGSGTPIQPLFAPSPGSATLGRALDAGNYGVRSMGFGYFDPPPAYSSYTFNFEVVPAPEPVSFVLLLGGLGLIGWGVMRRANRSSRR
jgi:hypothetical protein